MSEGLKLVPFKAPDERYKERVIALLEEALAEARDPERNVAGVLIITSYRDNGYKWDCEGSTGMVQQLGQISRVAHLINRTLDENVDLLDD